MSHTTMNDVVEVPTRRYSSMFPELDRVFGRSKLYAENGRVEGEEWGIARGKLWVLGGQEGVGKTKFYTMVAIVLAEFSGKKILLFQKEMSAGEYKEVLMNSYRSMNITPRNLENIVFENTKDLARQVELIREVKPDLVIDDSFNLTSSPNASSKDGIEKIVLGWKEAMGSHTAAWMIAHLNASGEIKGNGHLKYMVDAVLFLNWAKTPMTPYEEAHPESYASRYLIRNGKTRQGISGMQAYLRHRGDHSEVIRDAEVQKWNSEGGPSEDTSEKAVHTDAPVSPVSPTQVVPTTKFVRKSSSSGVASAYQFMK